MLNDHVWVIRNQDGLFVNPKYRSFYTGMTTGFTFYESKKSLRDDFSKLGKGYYLEYISFKKIPDGERVYVD